uniref:intraflagellar transport protein 56-like n=1 Tax=Myxine glutinosa TaxID=7769 RepID=UPI00358E2640
MNLSRAKPALASQEKQDIVEKKKPKVSHFTEFLHTRDYTGAATLLEFQKHSGNAEENVDLWLAYCHFHLGNYKKSMELYRKCLERENCSPEVWIKLACVFFYLGMYKEADETALKGIKSPLQSRLMFHLSHKFGDEKRLMSYHQVLQDVVEDQLSLASIHYLRCHYQEAIDIYKRIFLSNKEYVALNVYIAFCYYKMDFYDKSQEILALYLQNFPDSITAINLKACNLFRLCSGKDAERELGNLQEKISPSFEFAKELIQHNLVVFQEGEGALQVLPPLIDVIPEARLNLAIFHISQDDIKEAYNIMKDLEALTPQEIILKAVVNAAIGQETGSEEHLNNAQKYFKLVGGSASECDTIPGRQCMASCFFLMKHFEDVLTYLNSIKTYFSGDETFNFNYAQAKTATGNYKEAEEVFQKIQNAKIENDHVYRNCLARCYIMNRKPRLAWELYLQMETSGDSFPLLHIIANDCYKMGQFYFAAKAFDVLERLDSNPEYWEGKRGSCVGVLQMVIAGHERKDILRDIVQLLRKTGNPEGEFIVRAVKKWAKINHLTLAL